MTRCFFQNATTFYLLCISNDFFGIGLTGFSLVLRVSQMKISRVPQDGRWRTVLICMPLFRLCTQLYVASRGRDLNLTASLLFFFHDRITLTAASACSRSHFTLSGTAEDTLAWRKLHYMARLFMIIAIANSWSFLRHFYRWCGRSLSKGLKDQCPSTIVVYFFFFFYFWTVYSAKED